MRALFLLLLLANLALFAWSRYGAAPTPPTRRRSRARSSRRS